MYKSDDPISCSVLFDQDVDPEGILTLLACNANQDLFHGEDNIVVYFVKALGSKP